ncbi:MAG: OmpH family outer membrane protein [Sphingobacteriales bacterium]|jgi:outer membrane protein|nr:OmpH family outer membrane protein [Sphingobacteriales bacterium]
MKHFLQAAMLVLLCSCAALNLNAQKVGHLNTAELLTTLESWKSAQNQLQTHAQMLRTKLETQQKTFEDALKVAQEQEAAGLLTPKQIEEKQKEFETKGQSLQAEQQKMETDLNKKGEELLNPIREKVRVAIQTVAKEGGFSYIIDTSAGNVLFSDPLLDVTALVKSKL